MIDTQPVAGQFRLKLDVFQLHAGCRQVGAAVPEENFSSQIRSLPGPLHRELHPAFAADVLHQPWAEGRKDAGGPHRPIGHDL